MHRNAIEIISHSPVVLLLFSCCSPVLFVSLLSFFCSASHLHKKISRAWPERRSHLCESDVLNGCNTDATRMIWDDLRWSEHISNRLKMLPSDTFCMFLPGTRNLSKSLRLRNGSETSQLPTPFNLILANVGCTWMSRAWQDRALTPHHKGMGWRLKWALQPQGNRIRLAV